MSDNRSHTLTTDRLMIAATGGISIVIGEVFFKFGSFTLEVLAFLATWATLAKLGSMLKRP